MYRLALALCLWLHPLATWASEPVEISAGEFYACALYDDGAVYCWGAVPGDNPAGIPYVAQRIADLPPAIAIAAGRHGACAISEKHDLWCWGLDIQRTMRWHTTTISTKPVAVLGLPPVKKVSWGFLHLCALSTTGEPWCWGSNYHGEVSAEASAEIAEPVRVPGIKLAQDISAGVHNTCAILALGQAVCWGSDNPTMPGHPFAYETREPLHLDLSQFGRFTSVANGRNFACGIREPTLLGDRRVTCWGSNIFSQIGTFRPRSLSNPRGGVGEVMFIENATDLSAGYFSACAVDSGEVICWGLPLYEYLEPATDWDGNSPPALKPGRDFLPPYPLPGIKHATRVAIMGVVFCVIDAGQVKCIGPQIPEAGSDPPRDIIEGMRIDRPVPVPGLP